jgi:hypothetical protein
MANSTAGRRSSGGQLTIVFMAIAIVLVVGFMYWLAVSSEPSQVAAVRENSGDEAPTIDDSPAAVDTDQFAADPAAYRGRNVELQNVTVAAPIGTHAFWIDLPGGQPFLVRMAQSVVAEGRAVRAGETVSISGPVFERTDSVISAWQQEGVITTDGQRMEVEFAQNFIEARRVAGGQPGQTR